MTAITTAAAIQTVAAAVTLVVAAVEAAQARPLAVSPALKAVLAAVSAVRLLADPEQVLQVAAAVQARQQAAVQALLKVALVAGNVALLPGLAAWDRPVAVHLCLPKGLVRLAPCLRQTSPSGL